MQHGFVYRLVKAFVVTPLSPLLILTALLAGYLAIVLTPREEEPQIVVPMADVFVSFPGASSEEVEKLVATPLEKLLWQIDGVEHVYSVARRDGAVVTVRFFVGEDREKALIRIQSKIAANIDQAPSGVSGWIVSPVEIDDVPIVSLTLWSENIASSYELRRVAEEMASRLEEVPDLSRTRIVGGLRREVRVEIDPEALAARDLSPVEIVSRLKAVDASLPAGRFVQLNRSIPVVSDTFLLDVKQVGNFVIGVHNNQPVYLKDVAKIVDGPEDANSYSRIGFARGEKAAVAGKTFPSVTIGLSKKKGTNAVSVADEIVKRAHELERSVLPSSVHLKITRNYGETANEKVNELLFEILVAVVVVVVLIAFSLGWRAAFIVAAAVPIAFALTLFINLITGYTINRVTLFALVLSLGLVVDDPIVDVENIHRHYQRKKEGPLDALLSAIDEVRFPVIIATLAVIVSFLPMLFITGMMGPYMKPMALNVPVAMLMSMLVAFTITPWMSYHVLKGEYGKETHIQEEDSGTYYSWYRRVMGRLLDELKYRRKLFLGLGALALLAGVLVITGLVPLKMLPYDNKSEIQLVIDLPDGSSLEKTNSVVSQVEQYLTRQHDVTNFTSFIGTNSPIDFNGLVRHFGLREMSHQADIRVNLAPKADRSQQSHAFALSLRNDIQDLAERNGAKIKLVEVPPGPPVLSTVVGEVYGKENVDYQALIDGAKATEKELAKIPGVVDIDDMSEDIHESLVFVFDKEKAALHGVSATEVVDTLRLAVSGVVPARVHEPDQRESLSIKIILSRVDQSGAEKLGRIHVKSLSGSLVPIAELGKFEKSVEDQPIYHKDLKRVAFVTAEVAGVSPPLVVLKMVLALSKGILPAGTDVDWSGEGEWKITRDVFRDLGAAFLVALVGIYILLVIQTNSLLMPFIIMLAIPLGVVGIFPGFWILNLFVGGSVGGFHDPVWFTATGMIGMIALAGIVVRNAIILIDFIHAAQSKGMALKEAIIESGVRRTRPIILTAFAAMLGAFPITLDPIFSGLAWSLIFGLVASTVFTLVVVPVTYWLVYKGKEV